MNFTTTLSNRLQQELPGKAAQYKMASMRRLEELDLRQNLTAPENAKIAAVMLLLFQERQDWRVVLIRRTANPHDRHSGQISFPGGSLDPSDPDIQSAALREAYEELGTHPSLIQVAGRLTELYIPVSNFLVHPFVGIYKGQGAPSFEPQTSEVASILTPGLSHFKQPENKKSKDLELASGLTLRNVPYFDVDGHVLWGATAMILNEFLELGL